MGSRKSVSPPEGGAAAKPPRSKWLQPGRGGAPTIGTPDCSRPGATPPQEKGASE